MYHNFWISILDKYSFLENYLFRQKYERIEIKNLSDSDLMVKPQEIIEDVIEEEVKKEEEEAKKRKKKRRNNPYSQKGSIFFNIL